MPHIVRGGAGVAALLLVALPALAQPASPRADRRPEPATPVVPGAETKLPLEEPGWTLVQLPGGGWYRYETDGTPPDPDAPLVELWPARPSGAAPATRPAEPGDDRSAAEDEEDAALAPMMSAPLPQDTCLARREALATRLLELRGLFDVPRAAAVDVVALLDRPFSPWVALSVFGVPQPLAAGSVLVSALAYDFETQWRFQELVACERREGLR